jgi:hypothetical protein
MTIAGTEGLSGQQIHDEIQRGGRFVMFPYTISFVVITFSRNSEVKFIRAGQSTLSMALPYILLSLCFGWWGIPFGLIYTPISVVQCLSGGKDLTPQFLAQLRG